MSPLSSLSWKAVIVFVLCLMSLYTIWTSQQNLSYVSCGRSTGSTSIGTTTLLQQEPQPETKTNLTHHASYPAPYPHVMGLVHMAKTGGTYINSYLAAHFERICGNKGNSYDSTSFHQRIESILQKQRNNNDPKPCTQITCKSFQDSMSKLVPERGGYKINRGNVPMHVLKEIGFEDCDYIAMEIAAKEWNMIANRLAKSPMMVKENRLKFGNATDTSATTTDESLMLVDSTFRNDTPKERLELHVPCRDPVDHILSQCNDRKMEFYCNSSAAAAAAGSGGSNDDNNGDHDNDNDKDNDDLWWQELVDDCIIEMNRFGLDRWTTAKSTEMDIHVHCFDNGALPGYLKLMSQRLQPRRRIPTFVTPKTNVDRQKDKECLRQDTVLQAKVRDYLLEEYPYYRWCQQCLGGPNDLLR